MKVEQFRETFPSDIAVPDELAQFCRWHELDSPTVSGFRLYADVDNSIELWFGTPTVVDRFGVFGSGSDGSLFAIWRQDDGRQPVVFMDSDGQDNFVLASNCVDFLRLLAVGYDEIGFDNLSQPPEEAPDSQFRDWVKQTFAVAIPRFGDEIVEAAMDTHDDFQAWINTKVR